MLTTMGIISATVPVLLTKAPTAAGHHNEDEETRLALAGQTDDAAAGHLGQTGGEDAAAHNEQAYHHDDNGIGKTGKGLFGGEYAAEHQCQRCAYGHEVGTHTAGNEKRC